MLHSVTTLMNFLCEARLSSDRNEKELVQHHAEHVHAMARPSWDAETSGQKHICRSAAYPSRCQAGKHPGCCVTAFRAKHHMQNSKIELFKQPEQKVDIIAVWGTDGSLCCYCSKPHVQGSAAACCRWLVPHRRACTAGEFPPAAAPALTWRMCPAYIQTHINC